MGVELSVAVRGLAAALAACVTLSASAGVAADRAWSLHDAVGAPPTLRLSGSARARYEALGGQVRPGFGRGEDVTVLRTTLFAEYRTGPVRIGGEVYDSRAYGADRGGVLSANDVNALEPVQAYVGLDLGPALGRKSSVSVELGRMMLNIGSRRLVAADDFRNTTNSYTGAKIEAQAWGDATATLIYVLPQTRLPDGVDALRHNRVKLDKESGDAALWGGVAAKPVLPGKGVIEVEYFGFDERDSPGRPTRNRNLHSFGVHLFRDPEAGRLDYDIEAVRQVGTIRASTAPGAAIMDVSAGFAHAELGYQFGGAWRPHLALEYDWASGDRGGGRYNRFDTLFGMRRGDYAPSGLLAAIGRANIEAPGIRFEAAPGARLDLMAHYQPMWLDSATDAFSTTSVRDASGRSGRFAGQMLDGRLRYWLAPQTLRFEVDAVLLAKGGFLKDAPNAPRTGATVYGAASLTATF